MILLNEKAQNVIDLATCEIGSPYVFGAWGEYCTPANRKKRKKPQYHTIVSKCQVLRGDAKTCDGCKYQGDRMFDCRGFVHWVFEQVGISISGQGATSQYNTNANWVEKGTIDNMPEIVCAIYKADGNKKKHTGIYIGNGYLIDCSGEVKKRSLSSGWTHYGIPVGLYTDEELKKALDFATPMIRKGSRGTAVRRLQELLTEKGFDCGEVDGIFGTKTYNAVKAFQSAYGLKADGIVGPLTWGVLLNNEEE